MVKILDLSKRFSSTLRPNGPKRHSKMETNIPFHFEANSLWLFQLFSHFFCGFFGLSVAFVPVGKAAFTETSRRDHLQLKVFMVGWIKFFFDFEGMCVVLSRFIQSCWSGKKILQGKGKVGILFQSGILLIIWCEDHTYTGR